MFARLIIWGCCLLLGAASLHSGPARADEQPLDKAKEHFHRGETLYRLGNFKEALSSFQASLKLAQRPSIILNMAQCYRNLKKHEKALFFYKLYLSEYQRKHSGWTPPYKSEVDRHIKALEGILAEQRRQQQKNAGAWGRLWVEGVQISRAQVLVDGEPRVLTPMTRPIKVKPGKHRVQVKAEGHYTWSGEVMVPAGDKAAVVASLKPLPGRSTFWLVSTLGSAALTMGAEALALVYTQKANAHFQDTQPFLRDRNVAVAGHAVAGVMGAFCITSLVLYLRSGGAEQAQESGAALLPLPGGAAASLKLSF